MTIAEAKSSEDPTVLAALARSASKKERAAVARNPATGSRTLVLLSRDPSIAVRIAVASNPNLGYGMRYEMLRTEPDAHVRAAIVGHAPDVQKAKLRAAETGAEPSERPVPVRHMTPEELAAIARTGTASQKAEAARNPDIPEYAFDSLMRNVERSVRNSAAMNPKMGLEARKTFIRMETDPDIVLQVIAGARESQREGLRELARKSSSPTVRQAIPAKKEKPSTKCPTPDKKKFATESAALGKTVRVTRVFTGTPVKVYRCPCGAWHMTTKVKRRKRA